MPASKTQDQNKIALAEVPVEKPVEKLVELIEEDQETSNDPVESLALYLHYELLDPDYEPDDDECVEINVANPEFPIGSSGVTHRPETPTDYETSEKARHLAEDPWRPRDEQWNCYWDRNILLENRKGKGHKQLIELMIQRYEGVTNRILEGFGSVTYASGVTYQGPFDVKRTAIGIGRLIFPDGTVFDGEVKEGQAGRRGILRWSDGSVYEGSLHYGMRNGYGRFLDASSQSFYDGNWLCSHSHGYGRMTYYGNEKDYYQGQWCLGMPWGRGVRHWPSGTSYEGQWAMGLPHGEGSKLWKDKMIFYRGEFEEGVPYGYGIMQWVTRVHSSALTSGQRFYYGNFRDGVIDGYGVFTEGDGTCYKGIWTEGKKNGKFIVTLANGIVLDCVYVNNELFDSMKKFLVKESKEKFYHIPLPGPTVAQMNYAPYGGEPEASAILLPGTSHFLTKKFGLPHDVIAEEVKAIGVIMRAYLEPLITIYNVYNRLMIETACDNVYVLRAFQYWQVLVDVVIEKTNAGTDVQQSLFHLIRSIEANFLPTERHDVFSHPYQPVKPSEFFDRITVAAYLIEMDKQVISHRQKILMRRSAGLEDLTAAPSPTLAKTWSMAGQPLKHLIETRMFPYAARFKSRIFDDPKKSSIMFRYVSQLHRMYRYTYELYAGQEEVLPDGLTLETFCTMLKDAKIMGLEGVSSSEVLKLCEIDFPEVREGANSFTLAIPITFLEFVELLISVALTYKGSFTSAEEAKPTHMRKEPSYKGRLLDTVDSVVLTAQKNPFLRKNQSVSLNDFDPAFFAMLRGVTLPITSAMSNGDAGDAPTNDYMQGSGHTLGSPGGSSIDEILARLERLVESRDDGSGDKKIELFEEKEATVHPPVDPTEYEYADTSMPAGSQFTGYTIDYLAPKASSNKSLLSIRKGGCPLPFSATQVSSQTPFRQQKDHPRPPEPYELPSFVFDTDSTSSLKPPESVPSITLWETQLVAFFEQILFPKMILFKRTNDSLIRNGLLKPLKVFVEDDVLSEDTAERLLHDDMKA